MKNTQIYHPQDVRRFLAEYQAAHPEDVLTIDAELSDDQDPAR